MIQLGPYAEFKTLQVHSKHLLNQIHFKDAIHVVYSDEGTPSRTRDFYRLSIEKWNACWLHVTMDRIQKNRQTSFSFSMDKAQALKLIEKLQAMVADMTEPREGDVKRDFK